VRLSLRRDGRGVGENRERSGVEDVDDAEGEVDDDDVGGV
jgi:hypothetical protein